MSIKDKILNKIFQHYKNSSEFNGFPIREIEILFKIDKKEKNQILTELINKKKISLNFGDIHSNSYIKAYPAEDKEIQIKKLLLNNSDHICAYPTPEYLSKVVDTNSYIEKPFTRELHLGEAQLSYRVFDLSILEIYRNDPRYSFFNDDISGSISLKTEFHESNLLNESDKVLLQSFGFAHDKDGNRYIAVLLRYLCRLSSEHQHIWNSKILKGDFKLHPDYHNSIIGSWDRGMSVFEAILEEMHHINNLSDIIGRPKFFHEEFLNEKRPKEFGFLLRPTLKEFNNFILLFNKIIPDNINMKFFRNDIVRESVTINKDGTKVITPKRSVTILDEWLDKYFQKHKEKPHKDFIKAFKDLNRARQIPAHSIVNDDFDPKYFKEQKIVLENIYRGVQEIRFFLNTHPKAKDYKIPEELENGNIWIN